MNTTNHAPVLHERPLEIRLYVMQLLNQTLACTVDLHSQVKQACWNVKGTDFASLHALFATMATELDAYTDLVAERIAMLGGWH
jgi:starvation-inducible DNA-binding protein